MLMFVNFNLGIGTFECFIEGVQGGRGIAQPVRRS